MIKVQSETSKTIYPSLTSVSDDANSNYYLMEVENEQTKRKVAKVITKGAVTNRSVACSLDEVTYTNFSSSGAVYMDHLPYLLTTGDNWSMCLWFKHKYNTGNSDIKTLMYLRQLTTPSEFICVINADGYIEVNQYFNKVHVFDSVKVDDGNWHRLVLTQKNNGSTASKIKCYIDGKHIGNTAINFTLYWSNFDRYYLGTNLAVSGRSLFGELKDFQLWDYTLNGDDIKFDYDFPDFLASDRQENAAPVNRNMKTRYELSSATFGNFHNSYNDNLIDYPNDFFSWENISNLDISNNVALSNNGFKIADRITYDGVSNFNLITQTITNVPGTGEWRFGMWVKGEGNTIGSRGRLRFYSGTSVQYPQETIFIYTDQWQFVDTYTDIGVTGSLVLGFEPLIFWDNTSTARDPQKGDAIYAYGARFKGTTYDLTATLVASATFRTGSTPMFAFDDNAFYKYKIYEQTSKNNTDIYDDSILGLREEGKLFVQGIGQPEYVKQKDADSTNEVYLKI